MLVSVLFAVFLVSIMGARTGIMGAGESFWALVVVRKESLGISPTIMLGIIPIPNRPNWPNCSNQSSQFLTLLEVPDPHA